MTAIELCNELGVEVETATVPVETLRDADEAFITSTAGGIMPLTRVDNREIGDGRPGEMTQSLIELYWAKHDDPDWTTLVRR